MCHCSCYTIDGYWVTTPRPSKHRQAGSEWILGTTTPQSCHKLGIANTAYQRVREPCVSTVHFLSIHASCTGADGTTGSQHYSRHESKYITTLERAKDNQITRRGHTTQHFIIQKAKLGCLVQQDPNDGLRGL